MKKSMKAALWSGLVFPGIGQFVLKRYLRGLMFFAPAMTGLVFIIDNSMRNAMSIVEQIDRGEVPLDPAAISNLISKSSAGSEMLMLNIAQGIFIACWIFSIFDAYRLGKIADQTDSE